MNYSYSPQSDPASAAAHLLQRIGFLSLLLLLPLFSTLSRRAGVILFPATVGFFLAALVIAQSKPSFAPLKRVFYSVPAFSGTIILLWCAISLLWTPFFSESIDRLQNFIITFFLMVLCYWALPERVRASNVNLLPIGVFLSALSLIWTAMAMKTGLFETDPEHFKRALIVLLLFLWPALSWLMTRNHRMIALILLATVTLAVFLSNIDIAKFALGVGIVLFLITLINRQGAAYLLCIATGVLFFIAPFIGFFTPFLKGVTPDFLLTSLTSYEEWWGIIVNDPLRLVTGYGLEAAMRRHLSASLPESLIFMAWFELGILGALSAVALSIGVILTTLKSKSLMAPGVIAAFGTAFTCGMLGIRGSQSWWFTTIAALILVFVAAQRSQFQTQRPLVFFR